MGEFNENIEWFKDAAQLLIDGRTSRIKLPPAIARQHVA